MPPKKIVILGSGFAGVYAYLELHKQLHNRRDVEITMVSETDSFLFVPLIHEVATGSLSPSDVLQPIHTLPSCCLRRFVQGHVASVNCDLREISVTPHRPSSSTDTAEKEISAIPYDYLISGIGSETNFFGVPGAREYALPLKDLSDAVKIKNRIIEIFECAEKTTTKEERADALRFVVVGAGPTGLEIAAEMADYLRHEFAKAFPSLKGLAEIIIVDGVTDLLPVLNPWFGKKAARILAHKKIVRVLLNTPIVAITPGGVRTKEKFFPAGTVIWSAGVKARQLPMTAKKPVNHDERSGRIMVNAFLQIPAYTEVFIAGDQAWIRDKENDQPYPMRAQFAQREGRVAARNVARLMDNRPLEEFAWKDQGIIISLGKGGALAQIYGVRASGPLAWWIYRTVYASKILGWRARARTVLGWMFDLFLPRDISQL